jgi:UDP-glucuronate 4-epimerase
MQTDSRYDLILFAMLLYISPLIAKHVVVTGGAGFIGSHVVERLIARGDTVFVLDILVDQYKISNLVTIQTNTKKSPLLRYIPLNITDVDALHNFFATHPVDVICHLAAQPGVQQSLENPVSCAYINIIGTIAILEMAHTYAIPQVVIASSSSVYGDDSHVPFHEEAIIRYPCSPYAATKCATELLAYTYHALYDINCTCLRFFTVYGPRGRLDMAPFIFMNAIHREFSITLYGDGSAIRDFTYVSDIVDGIVKAIDIPYQYEIINLGRGEPITLTAFIAALEIVIGKRANIIHVERRAGDVDLTHADIRKAQQLLGYEPKVSILDGLRNMYAWYCTEFLM